MELTFEQKLAAFKAIITGSPQLLEDYFILYIQQRNIQSGANSMGPWSGLTLIDPDIAKGFFALPSKRYSSGTGSLAGTKGNVIE